MNKEKLKEPHETAKLEIILFEFSDIVTTSIPEEKPGLDNMDSWT